MAAAVENLELVFTKLREVGARRLTSDCQRNLGTVLCDALVLRVSLIENSAVPNDALELLADAVQHGERAYQSKPPDRNAVNAYSRSLERLGASHYHSAPA